MFNKALVGIITMIVLGAPLASLAAPSPFGSGAEGDFRPGQVWEAAEHELLTKHERFSGLAVLGAISPSHVASGPDAFSVLVSVVNEGRDDVFIFMDIRDSSRIVLSSEGFFENMLGSRVGMPENYYPLKLLKGSESADKAVTPLNSFVTKIPIENKEVSVEAAKIELVVTVRGFERNTGQRILHRERIEILRNL